MRGRLSAWFHRLKSAKLDRAQRQLLQDFADRKGVNVARLRVGGSLTFPNRRLKPSKADKFR
jgi:hypothetical protein